MRTAPTGAARLRANGLARLACACMERAMRGSRMKRGGPGRRTFRSPLPPQIGRPRTASESNARIANSERRARQGLRRKNSCVLESAPFFATVVHEDIETILLSEAQILQGIDRVAAEVTRAYAGREFTVMAVLKGSCVFASDLIRRVPLRLELAFVAASSYRDGTTSGRLDVNYFPADGEIAGRELLLVDDILDTGRTMQALKRELLERGARSVRTCVFLDKPARRAVDLRADHSCFEIEDKFVVGYGLDFAGAYRNLPYLGVLRQAAIERSRTAPLGRA
ncbi:MAG: hypoxanthine phosphoribosyltransferase [Planctomycetes bacterium]|nr:hypoxanthine phosphoribosyltransferase [Planctomycetota bacterium]